MPGPWARRLGRRSPLLPRCLDTDPGGHTVVCMAERERRRLALRAVRVTFAALAAVAVLLPGALWVGDKAVAGKVVTNNPRAMHGPQEASRYVEDLRQEGEVLPEASGKAYEVIEPVEPSKSFDAWEADLYTRETSRELTHGRGPSMRKAVAPELVPDPVRILVVGDSYVYGYSHEVQGNMFTNQLEQMLNAKTNGGYEVVTLGTDQSSFLRQSDWVTAQRLRDIDPDVVVLTHTIGRLQPSFMERKYCSQFNTCIDDGERRPVEDATGHTLDRANAKWKIIMCLRADESPVSWLFRKVLYPYFTDLAEFLAVRYCNEERILAGVDLTTERSSYEGDLEKHPYIGDLDQALARVRSAVDALDRPVATYVLNLPWQPEHLSRDVSVDGRQFRSMLGPIFDLYDRYGFTEVERTHADAKMLALRIWDANGVQGHSQGTKDNRCVYDCMVTPEQWQENMRMYREGIITHPMKYRQGNTMQFALAQDVADLVLDRHPYRGAPSEVGQKLVAEYAPGFLVVEGNGPQRAGVHHYERNREAARSNGFQWKDRWVSAPCPRMDAPHSIIAVNSAAMARADRLTVGYQRGERDTLVIMFEVRDTEGNLVPGQTVRLQRGSSYTLENASSVTNIYVADPTVGCEDPEVAMPTFDLRLETTPR